MELEWDRTDYPGPIAFSPDGKFFACRFPGGTVRLWEVPSAKPEGFAQLKKPVHTLGVSEPGYIAGSDGHARHPIRFSPDGSTLAVCGPGAAVTIWDPVKERITATLTGHHHKNPELTFSPDGAVVFLGLTNPGVQLWDAKTGKFLRGFDTGEPVYTLAVAPDGKTVASGADDRIIVSDVETGKERLRLEVKGMSFVVSVAFTPDGKSLVSCGQDEKVRVWDLATGKARLALDNRGSVGRVMALSRDGKTIACGTQYNLIRVWDVATGKELSAQADGHDAPIRAVSVSPDGRTLVTGGENEQIRLWDAATLRQIRLLKGRSADELSVSPDGQRLVIAEEEGDRARVLNLKADREELPLVPRGVRACPFAAFARDGKTIVTASWREDGTPARDSAVVHVWDGQTGKRLRELVVADIRPWGLALSPDGRWAVITGQAGAERGPETALVFCDLVRNRERTMHLGDTSEVLTATFSSDGRVLATGCADRTVRLWEVASGREIAALNGHGRGVGAVVFTPGGRILATADGGYQKRGRDEAARTIRFWDVATGKELGRFSGYSGDVTALAFTPDGKRLVAGLSNGTALVWETPAAKPAVAGRKLGPKELAALWGDLAGTDATVAHDAIRILAAAPEQTVPFLADTLHPAEKIDAVAVRQRIADLGSGKFAEREAALKELSARGEDIEGELERVLAGKPTPEVAQRLRGLLTALRDAPPMERLREVRAVWALELIGTPAADKLLKELAKGSPEALVTREAKGALERRAGP
jgi:WD40 repeat protein